MARARSGNAIQSKIQMTIYGEPFTGKSTMASQFAYMKNPDGSPFKVLYLDPESGSIKEYSQKRSLNDYISYDTYNTNTISNTDTFKNKSPIVNSSNGTAQISQIPKANIIHAYSAKDTISNLNTED